MLKKKKPHQYPLLITVGSRVYHVVFVRRLNKAVGMFDDNGDVIYLSMDQDPNELLATFFHEILHAIEREHRIKIGHPKIKKLEYVLRDLFLNLLKMYKAKF